MATTLAVGDIAIVQYSTSADAFSFVFLGDVEAGTTVNFTDNGWLARGGFRAGETAVTYTAATVLNAGTIVTLTGLDLDETGDQIIAYQGDAASPTILHLIDFADGNNTVAGDATDDNSTALPPGFSLGANAIAVAFDSSLYAGPTSGSTEGLFAALNNSANWIEGDALPVPFVFNAKPTIDLDADNSSHTGLDYEASVTSGGAGVPVADTDVAIDDNDGTTIFAAEIDVNGKDPRDVLTVNGSLPAGIVATAYDPAKGVLRLEGQASHADYETAIRQVEFSTTDSPDQTKRVLISVFDGDAWSKDGTAFIHVERNLIAARPELDLDVNNSTAGGADATATYTAGGQRISVTDIDVLITDPDTTTMQSATITILGWARNPGDLLSVAGALPSGITASAYSEITGVVTLSGTASLADYQTALHQVVYSNTLSSPSTADRGIEVTVNGGTFDSNAATMYMHVVIPPPNAAPVLDLDANNSTTPGANYLTGFTEGGPPVAIADADVLILDTDSPNLASAAITLTNPQTDDVLIFEGTPPLGIAVSGSGTNVVTLTGAASSTSYQTALQQVTFSNSDIDPSNVTRVVEVVVNDGVSNSNIATTVVQVEAVNNSAPVVDLDPNELGGSIRGTFHTNFTENGTPTPIADTDTAITDLDSTTLASATITLANQHSGDLLTVGPLPNSIVASAYDPGTGVLTLTGLATLAEYETALQQVLYSNTSDNPVTEDRLIEVVVNDGASASNAADTLIGVVAVNDAPVLQVDPIVTYLENTAPITLSPLATLSDVDDTELNDLTVRITGGEIAGDGDMLTVGGRTSGTINGITFLWHPADHALVFTGASAVTNYEDLLRSVEYYSTSDNPTDFNASSARTLTWSVSGGTAVTTETTTLNIVAVNDAPEATVAASASYTENGTPVVISPAATVTDVDDINLVSGEVRIVSGAVDGDLLTVGDLPSGTFSGIEFSYDATRHSLTFTEPASVTDYQTFLQAIAFSSTSDDPTDSGLSPTRTLSWFVFDGDAFNDARTTVVSITAVNDPPVNTVPGPQSINEDTTLPIAGVSVTDVDTLTLTSTLTVASGTLHVTAGAGVSNNDSDTVTISGTPTEINAALVGIAYTGNLNFNGSDTLAVTTSDGTAQDTSTVAITVNPVNDAPVAQDGSASGNEDTPINGTAVATDVDSASLTYNLAAQAAHGTAVVNPDGSYIYTPNADFNGTDTFTFTASDGTAASNAATISLTVNPVNDAPVAQDGSASGNEDTPINGTAVATDVDSASLTYNLAAQAAHGTAVVNPDGSYIYTPNADFNGTDTFTFTASDGTAASNAATISLTVNPVNDAPVAQDGSASGNEDTPINGTAVATDVDSASLTYNLAAQAAHGTAVVNPDGSYIYTPNADFNGTDTFTFTASDGTAASNAATISLTVNPVNDAPVAQDGSASGNEDTPINGTAVATDVDSASLTYNLAAQAAHGTAVVNPDGSYIYTPNADFNGTDTFTFTASDGTAASNAATISLTVNPVNDAPVAQDGSASGNEDTPINGTAVATDVDSASLTYNLAAQAAHGTAVVNPDGSYIYTPNADFNGTDTFTFTASDGTAASNAATISLTVNPVNDAPVAANDDFATDEAAVISGLNVFNDNGHGADADPDSPSFAVATINGVAAGVGSTITLPSGARFTLNANGTFSYNPNHAFDLLPAAGSGATNLTATDTFTYADSDGSLTGNAATVTVTVSGVDSNDLLRGSFAAGTTLTGGIGNDTYVVNNTATTINDASGGTDVVYAEGVSYSLQASATGIEAMIVENGTGLTGTGYSAAPNILYSLDTAGQSNTLTGGTAADYLSGGLGTDHLLGGDGNDLYVVHSTATTISDTSGTTDIAYVEGVDYSLADGDGVDYVVLENGTGHTATGHTSLGTTLYSVDTAGQSNTLIGGAGADLLSGGLGADHLIGGDGNDTYAVYSAATTITDTGGATDVVYAESTDFALTDGDGIEALIADGTGHRVTGHATQSTSIYSIGTGNTLAGGSAQDILTAGAHGDTLIGNGGNDFLIGGAGNDTFQFGVSFGQDVVYNFQPHGGGANGDTIRMTNEAPGTTFASMVANNLIFEAPDPSQASGVDVIVEHDANNYVVLLNHHVADLSASDFLFA